MREKKITVTELLFFCAYIPYLVILLLELSLFREAAMFQQIVKVVRYATYLLLIIKLLGDGKFHHWNLLGTFAIIGLLTIGAFFAKEKQMIFLFLYMIAGYNIKFEKIIKVSFFVHLACMMLIMLSCAAGILDNRIYEEGMRLRYSLGYGFTTTGANLFMHMTLMYLFWRKEDVHWTELLFLFLGNLYFFVRTDTKASFAMGEAAVAAAAVLKLFRGSRERYRHYGKWLPLTVPLFAGISVLSALAYDPTNPVHEKINIFVNGRLGLGHDAYEKYGLKWFGSEVQFTGATKYETGANALAKYTYVDSSYMQIAIQFGLIFLILVCLYYMLLLQKTIVRNDVYLGMILMVILVHSILDPQLVMLSFNPFLLGISYIFSRTDQGIEREEGKI